MKKLSLLCLNLLKIVFVVFALCFVLKSVFYSNCSNHYIIYKYLNWCFLGWVVFISETSFYFQLLYPNWGLHFRQNGMIRYSLILISVTPNPFPSELLKVVFCSNTSFNDNGGYQLVCTKACSICFGTDCLNCQGFLSPFIRKLKNCIFN